MWTRYSLGLTILAVLTLGLTFHGCFLTDNHPPARNAAQLLSLLNSPDSLVQDSALHRLEDFVFLRSDLPAVYESLRQEENEQNQLALIQVLKDIHNETTPGFIKELYPQLPNALLRSEALQVLSTVGTEEAINLQSALILADPNKLKGQEIATFFPLYSQPTAIAHLFPELLPLSQNKSYRLPIIELFHTGLIAEAIPPQVVQENVSLLINLFQAIPVHTAQPTTPAELEHEKLADLLLNCMSFYPAHPEINQLLLSSQNAPSPSIQLAATAACLRGNIPISPSQIENLAKTPSTRIGLYQLAENYPINFPNKYKTQLHFAEADLAMWLESKGKGSSEFRELEKVPLNEEGVGNVYLFEFRSGNRWLLGISGPQPADSTQVIEAGYLTGSKFTPKGRQSAEDWVKEFIE